MSESKRDVKSDADREEGLFQEAIELTGTERATFLNGACYGDPAMRERLEARLTAHKNKGSPQPADGESTTLHYPEQVNRPTHPVDEVEGSLIGRYKLLEKLGEGGFGAVWLAEQKEPVRRKVALKIIKLGMDTNQVVARFEAERQALAMMEHPNIAKVLDAGSTNFGRPYFVMELVRGIRITDYCDQAKLSTKERLDLFIKVCQAIQHAHQKGVIHRDIKPSNILVTLHDGEPVPKVIDFGIAKATQGDLTEKTIHTQFQQFIGTPAYTSPEQAEMSGLDIDTRSDIYSLGVLLYELLVGSTPFDAGELMASGLDAMRETIREKEPARPSTRLATLSTEEQTTTAKRRSVTAPHLIRQLSGDLDWIVMKCLEKDRSRRYETANGLAADIKRHVENEAVSARPPSIIYKLGRAIRRNKLAFASAGVVCISLILGLSLATAAWWKARAERDAAVSARLQADAARAGEAVQRERAQTAQAREAQLRAQAEVQELAARRRAYAADMNRVQQELAGNNLRRARDLLGRHSPHEGETDVRGWEWRYLWRQCRGNSLFKFCHQSAAGAGGIWYAGYTVGGNQVVTCNREAEITFWDSASRKGVVKLQEPIRPQPGSWAYIRAPRLSDDGAFLAAPGWKNQKWVVRVWNTATQSIVTELQFGEKTSINALAFSPDKKRLAVYVVEEGVSLWEIGSGKKLGAFPIAARYGPVFGAVIFSPDGKALAIGDDAGRVHLIDASNLRETVSFSVSSIDGVISLAFSPDGRALAVGCAFSNPQITVWDTQENKRLATLEGHHGFVASLAFSPDGQTLASASGDQMIKLWSTTSWKEEGTLTGHIDEVWSVAFSRDGKSLLSAGKDGSVYVWPAKVLTSDRSHFELPLEKRGWGVSPDGKTAAAVVADGRISIWDVTTGQRKPTTAQFSTNNLAVFFSSAGEMLVGSSKPAEIKVFNSENDSLTEYPLNWKEPPDVFWFLPRDRSIWAAHIDASIPDATFTRWDSVSRRELPALTAGWRFATFGDLTDVAFSSDEALIAVASGPMLVVRNLETGREECSFDFPRSTDIQGMTFIPLKRMLVAASLDAPIANVWDITTRRRIASLNAHNQLHASITASPDGQRLVTTTIGDEPIKIWDTTSWEEVANFHVPGSGLRRGQFLVDGNTLVAQEDRNGNVHFWRAPSWAQIEAVEASEKAVSQSP